MVSKQIDVMVVDDSPISQDLLKHIIENDPTLRVIEIAYDGYDALEKLNHCSPDVITIDINMPKMDGFKLTQKIMQMKPTPIVIISSHYVSSDVDKSFQAMDSGALAIMEKPPGPKDEKYQKTSRHVIQTIKVMAGVKVITRHPHLNKEVKIPDTIRTTISHDIKNSFHALGIGGSLGGPQAVHTLLTSLPGNFPIPIYIVQHISKGFVRGMVDWLKEGTKLEVKVARSGERGYPGCVYIAPDECHMEVDKNNVIHLIEDKNDNVIKPAVARLFRSMATSFGPKGIGVILTGMGRDGAEDLLYMRSKGAYTIAQDQESSVMWGMPKEAIRLGAAKTVASLYDIPELLQTLVKSKKET